MSDKLRKVSILPNTDLPFHKVSIDETLDGWFHCWGGTSELVYAVIELNTGLIEKICMNEFVFRDSPE